MPLNILEMNYKEAKSMFKESIRPLVVAVIKKEDKILVMPGYDKVKNEHFYRLPGGGIEFGETSEDALKREFREEIGAEIKIIKQIGISENIFTYEGKKGHEIVIAYEAELEEEYMLKSKIPMIEKQFANMFFEFVSIFQLHLARFSSLVLPLKNVCSI